MVKPAHMKAPLLMITRASVTPKAEPGCEVPSMTSLPDNGMEPLMVMVLSRTVEPGRLNKMVS